MVNYCLGLSRLAIEVGDSKDKKRADGEPKCPADIVAIHSLKEVHQFIHSESPLTIWSERARIIRAHQSGVATFIGLQSVAFLWCQLLMRGARLLQPKLLQSLPLTV